MQDTKTKDHLNIRHFERRIGLTESVRSKGEKKTAPTTQRMYEIPF